MLQLEEIRLLDVARYLAAPAVGRLIAEPGVEIITAWTSGFGDNDAVPEHREKFRVAASPAIDDPVAPLGQHIAEVLTDRLGYDSARIDALVQAGVLVARDRQEIVK